MKTIGVLGGIGPQATMAFQALVHREAQRLIPQDRNFGYPPMVVSFFRALPMVLGPDGAADPPLRPHPGLLEAARRLGALADFVVVTSNFTHTFAREIEAAAGRPLLSLIETTLAEIRRRDWRRVGVLGFGDPVIYTRPLLAEGRACETIEPPLRDRLDRAIFDLMEARDDDAARASAHEGVETLRGRRVDGVVLGCTEIPLLLRLPEIPPDLIDPAALLAEAAVRRSLEP